MRPLRPLLCAFDVQSENIVYCKTMTFELPDSLIPQDQGEQPDDETGDGIEYGDVTTSADAAGTCSATAKEEGDATAKEEGDATAKEEEGDATAKEEEGDAKDEASSGCAAAGQEDDVVTVSVSVPPPPPADDSGRDPNPIDPDASTIVVSNVQANDDSLHIALRYRAKDETHTEGRDLPTHGNKQQLAERLVQTGEVPLPEETTTAL